jgi:hypothetical protein
LESAFFVHGLDRSLSMNQYDIALFFHLLGAFMLVAGTVVAGVGFEAARRHTEPAEIALLLGLTRVGVLLVAVGAVVVLAFGLWLVELGHWGYGSWVAAALGLLGLTVLVGGLGGQRPKQARKLAVQLRDSTAPATAHLRALLDDRTARAANYLSALLLLTIIAVMVFKPGA